VLIDFSVENFLSFDDKETFTMLIDKSKTENMDITVNNLGAGAIDKVLKSAVIFGANASGKSNLIKSIDISRQIIVEGFDKIINLKDKQFRFNDGKKDSKFVFTFECENRIYEYGFTINYKMVTGEWLVNICKEGNDVIQKILFERIADGNGVTKIEIDFNSELVENEEDRKLLEAYAIGMTRENKGGLFLHRLYENNYSNIKHIFEWFSNIIIIYPDARIRPIWAFRSVISKEFTDALSIFLRSLDTGISEVKVSKKRFDFDKDFIKFANDRDFKNDLKDTISKMEDNSLIQFGDNNEFYFITKDNDEYYISTITTEHRAFNKSMTFEYYEESDGTKRLFELAPIILDAKFNKKVCLIDELDKSLHTIINKKLLEYFMKSHTNSQLIVTTHDTNMMDLDFFREDQIWFIYKNRCQQSKLIPMCQINRDERLNPVRSYLDGRFRGIPNINEFELSRLMKESDDNGANREATEKLNKRNS